jgi:DNA polymerase III alpha subunit
MSNQSPAFTHLEVHSHYTLLGSPIAVSELAARAAADNLSRLALTDTNALYGALAFNRACLAVGVQPLIGMTVTVAAPSPESPPGHLVVLATGPDGYRALCRLSSLIQASPAREQLAARGLSWPALAEQRAGLLALSGGRRGWIERHLRAGDDRAASMAARQLAEIYGDQAALCLELHRPADEAIVREIAAIGRTVGLPCVAVQPVYTLSRRIAANCGCWRPSTGIAA